MKRTIQAAGLDAIKDEEVERIRAARNVHEVFELNVASARASALIDTERLAMVAEMVTIGVAADAENMRKELTKAQEKIHYLHEKLRRRESYLETMLTEVQATAAQNAEMRIWMRNAKSSFAAFKDVVEHQSRMIMTADVDRACDYVVGDDELGIPHCFEHYPDGFMDCITATDPDETEDEEGVDFLEFMASLDDATADL